MEAKNELSAEQQTGRTIKRRTFLSFSVFAIASASAIGLWSWFRSLPKTHNKLSSPARKILSFNERVNKTFYSNDHLAPTYNRSEAAANPRVNGRLGLNKSFEPATWTLHVVNSGRDEIIDVTLNSLAELPKTEIVFDFKCIEGWNEVVHYGGVRFSDFLLHYKLGTKSGTPIDIDRPEDWFSYVGLETPDRKYFVGIDMKSMLHPQTILCYEMNGNELPLAHGAPLRLIIPVKYGVKNLKRIGQLSFSNEPPRDYWHERGYDYDLAL